MVVDDCVSSLRDLSLNGIEELVAEVGVEYPAFLKNM
jgi:hypothetical protein